VKQPEAEKQIALADRILVTKSDLAAPDDIAALSERIGARSTGAQAHGALCRPATHKYRDMLHLSTIQTF